MVSILIPTLRIACYRIGDDKPVSGSSQRWRNLRGVESRRRNAWHCRNAFEMLPSPWLLGNLSPWDQCTVSQHMYSQTETTDMGRNSLYHKPKYTSFFKSCMSQVCVIGLEKWLPQLGKRSIYWSAKKRESLTGEKLKPRMLGEGE